MIRKATKYDLPAVLAMSRRFYATTAYAGFADFDTPTVEKLTLMLIEKGIVLLADVKGEPVGMVGLVVAPFMFNDSIRGAYEVVWWVNPEMQSRGIGTELLQAIEPACKEADVRLIQMVCLATSPAKAGQLYERVGYAHSETSYTKVI